LSDIKRAYRKLAKKYHPDANPGQQKDSAKRFQEVVAAYKVLGNERERARYDLMMQTSIFNDIAKDPVANSVGAQATGILEDLLRGDGKRALQTYDEFSKREDLSLESCMDTRDYLDCVFLMAEQMERSGRNKEAVRLYEELYIREKEPPRHRFFFEEVKVRLKKLYSRKLPKEAESPEEEIDCYRRILEFDVDRSERAFILKKIAEVYLKICDVDKAKKIFREALDLKPGLKGTATIRERLGFKPAEK